MTKMHYYKKDCDLSLFEGKAVAIARYGSQGHAHAQNLRDSSANIIIGPYEGSKSAEQAKKDGFSVFNTDEAVQKAGFVMMLINIHYKQMILANGGTPMEFNTIAARQFGSGPCRDEILLLY